MNDFLGCVFAGVVVAFVAAWCGLLVWGLVELIQLVGRLAT